MEKEKKNEVSLSDYMTFGDRIKLEMFMLVLTIWLISPFLFIVYLTM